jgi:ComF family protein
MRRASAALGDLLLEKIDQLPSGTIVVPIPTVSAHIRQRGYDHSKLIAKYIARKRGLKYNQALERVTATKQRGASKAVREKQARKAFAVRGSITPDVPYLLIDDVVTTGATMRYAAQALLDGGASHVWAAAIARQPLD